MTTIDGKTKVYAVIGNPVAHSFSPLIQNLAFAHHQLNAVYVALPVTAIGDAITGMRALDLQGLSVTIPHKEQVMAHLDACDQDAERIGAVNTIVRRDNRLIGYNTDGRGALRALEAKTQIKDAAVTIMGAGGGARAVGYALRAAGARLTIVNRSIERGRRLAGELKAMFIPLKQLNGLDCQILINTTPVGMTPNADNIIVSPAWLHDNMVVMDLVYNPLQTRLLTAAAAAGCQTVDGLGMLVYQGAIQFELWTGKRAPLDQMMQTAYQILQSRQQAGG